MFDGTNGFRLFVAASELDRMGAFITGRRTMHTVFRGRPRAGLPTVPLVAFSNFIWDVRLNLHGVQWTDDVPFGISQFGGRRAQYFNYLVGTREFRR